MKVVDWNQYKMRRQAQRQGGPFMALGNATAMSSSSPSTLSSDRIRMDCLQRYVKAQLTARVSK